jgi:pimeloyl-ACP methyl ester carboxylesterase
MKLTIDLKNIFRPLPSVTGKRSEREMGLKGICLSLALALIPVGSASAAHLTVGKVVGGVEVEVRRPGNGVYPLVIFSHGMGSCPGSTDGIQSALADKGYIVVAPKHRDCFSGDTTPDSLWGEPENWTDQSNRDRRDDIHAVLDALPYSRFAEYIQDFSNVGCMGHSMGGYTCMGVAGAWASWTRSEISAVAALSPWHKPFTEQNRVGDMTNAHTLYQGGTRDAAITPQLMELGGTFDQTSPAKYLQVFDQAGHSAWTEGLLNERFHEEMSYYINSFFDAFLKGGNKKKLTQRQGRVSTLDYDHK